MRPPPRLRYQLVAFLLARTVTNTLFRMVYPFSAVLARGMGVPLSAVAAAIAARSGVGIAAPLLGSLADHRGRRWGMLAGLSLFVVGAGLVVLRPVFPVFVAALLLTTIGKVVFDPSMQAHLGETTEYRRRGQTIALTELGWSVAFLIGVPTMAAAIDFGGWHAPFLILAALAAAAALLLRRLLPGDERPVSDRPAPWQAFRRLVRYTPALAGLGSGVLISAANETVNIVFGVWLEGSFGFQVAALGAAAAVIGLAELAGEGGVLTLADRLGKRRAVLLGLALNIGACLLLPILARSPSGALLALFLFYLTFEFTLVSTIPLMTELVPRARATLMSANVASHSAGRVIGATVGIALFPLGLRANTLATIGLNLAAAALVFLLVREEAAPD